MFTGIIEEIGKVKELIHLSNGARIKVECFKILEDTKIGDSIAINGCCQTVAEIAPDYFAADVSSETLNITNFSSLKGGNLVNLERALTPSSRIGGHIVQGHIDCTGKFLEFKKLSNFYDMIFELPHENIKYVVKKGSIAVNGVSLTTAEINGNIFKAAVIPHTYRNTNLHSLASGEIVNIETDILGRYVEKFLSPDNNNSTLTENFLKENGFL